MTFSFYFFVHLRWDDDDGDDDYYYYYDDDDIN